MEYFDRDNKYNFVDENNIVVGYDSNQDCCEWASWFISSERFPNNVDEKLEKAVPKEMGNWIFDPKGFRRGKNNYEAFEDGGYVSFRLLDKETKRMTAYLILFNIHNGYYAHGFTMEVGGILKQSGDL
jgi:hypothetical protein